MSLIYNISNYDSHTLKDIDLHTISKLLIRHNARCVTRVYFRHCIDNSHKDGHVLSHASANWVKRHKEFHFNVLKSYPN